MNNSPINVRNMLNPAVPIQAVMSDANVDIGLLSDKATIATQFFATFPHQQRQKTEADADAIKMAALSFVKQLRIGRWEMFVLLDSAFPDIDIMFLFYFLQVSIGQTSGEHLFFEQADGVLMLHRN